MFLPLLFARLDHYFFGILMTVTAIFLILLVLVQRGKGGGLAGAFGGMGGQSAFGTKAGDTFTRITIVSAAFWILLCILAVKWLSPGVLPGGEEANVNNAASEDGANESPGGGESMLPLPDGDGDAATIDADDVGDQSSSSASGGTDDGSDADSSE